MKKNLLQTIVLLIAIHCLRAQDNYVTITGKLEDAKSKEPLPFASIYLKGTTIGTTSNPEGSFLFHVPANFKNTPIVISMIGYESVEKIVSDFEENGSIHLKESALALDEVVVTSGKPLTAKQIVKAAYKAVKSNYPTQPYILEGFIRDLQNEDSVYVEFLEYAAKIYYQSNEIKKIPTIELVALRRNYIANKNPWNDQWDRKNAIIDLVEDDFIRFAYRPIKAGNGWKYEVESIVPFDGKLAYKITAVNEPFYHALFFIDLKSFAFVRIEYSRSTHNGRYYKRRLTNGQQEASYNIVFEYQQYKDKWYLKYQKEEDTWKIFKGPETDELLFTKYPKKELFINKVITDDVDKYPFMSNHDPDKSIESQAKPYDPDFWKFYNAPTRTKALSKIEAYLKSEHVKVAE